MSISTLTTASTSNVKAGLFSGNRKALLCAELPTHAKAKARKKAEKDSDTRLVELTLQGQNKAFDMLVIKYQTRIMRLVSVYIQDSDAAKDVVQETFIRAYKALRNYRRESQFYTWLYRIAVNTSYNYLKSNKSWINRMESIEGNSQAERAESQFLDPERSYQNDNIRSGIHRAVSQLPLDLRCALLLREIEGLSYEQIAEVVGCELGTVKSRISRARERVVQKTAHLFDAV